MEPESEEVISFISIWQNVENFSDEKPTKVSATISTSHTDLLSRVAVLAVQVGGGDECVHWINMRVEVVGSQPRPSRLIDIDGGEAGNIHWAELLSLSLCWSNLSDCLRQEALNSLQLWILLLIIVCWYPSRTPQVHPPPPSLDNGNSSISRLECGGWDGVFVQLSTLISPQLTPTQPPASFISNVLHH